MNRLNKTLIYLNAAFVVGLACMLVVAAFTGPTANPPGNNTTVILPISLGGTSTTTALGARSNLGLAGSGVNSDITALTGLTAPLSIAHGGTGLSSVGASGNILTSNGTSWISAPAPSLGSNGHIVPVGGTPSALPGSAPGTFPFSCSGGSLQSFTVPTGVSSMTVTANAPQGSNTVAGGAGGYGGQVVGTLSVTPGSTYYFTINCQGSGMTWFSAQNTFSQGTVLLLAGGGGNAGSAANAGSGSGGAGGYQSGNGGSNAGGGTYYGGPGWGGGGGSQSAGGGGGAGCSEISGTHVCGSGSAGTIGAGGGGSCSQTCGGTGGAGYWGGGGGGGGSMDGNTYGGGGGGGGSSYASGSVTSPSFTTGANAGDGNLTIVVSQTLPVTVVGTDADGVVTFPNLASVLSTTLSFASAFPGTPSCLGSTWNGVQVTVGSANTSSITFNFSSNMANASFNYICVY